MMQLPSQAPCKITQNVSLFILYNYHSKPTIFILWLYDCRDDEPDVEDGMSEDEWVVWLKRRKDENGLCVNWTGKFVFEETNED